jgi:hypothetical protein
MAPPESPIAACASLLAVPVKLNVVATAFTSFTPPPSGS